MLANVSVLRDLLLFRDNPGLYSDLFNMGDTACFIMDGYVHWLIMVALCNRADHYIFALWFLSIFFPFFPRLISAAVGWMSTIL